MELITDPKVYIINLVKFSVKGTNNVSPFGQGMPLVSNTFMEPPTILTGLRTAEHYTIPVLLTLISLLNYSNTPSLNPLF